MSLIPEEHRQHLRIELSERMDKPVRVLVFTQELECHFCAETRQIAQELASLNDKITVEVHDFVADYGKAKDYGVDKVPALVIIGEKDYGIRFYGFPFGYEFQTFTESVINVSRGKTDLSDRTRELLKEVKTPVHVQVFVTLTCPHCPAASAMANKFAIESDFVKADVIDANEFTPLAVKYSVLGVPKVVMNEKVEFVGVLPEDLFLEHLLLAAASSQQS